MALAAILLAVIIGLSATVYAVAVGLVGFWGAVGLYIGAGWATIAALFIANALAGFARKTRPIMSDATAEHPVMVSKHTTTRR